MKWLRFMIETIPEAEDILVSDMYDIGLEGAQIEDKLPLTPLEKERMFVDIPPAPQDDDGIAYVSFFVEVPAGAGEAAEVRSRTRKAIEEQLAQTALYCDIGSGRISVSETEDIDWINNWKQYFHSFRIGDILLIPSWEDEEAAQDAKYVLHIDPGTAFGTGMHETTRLCIEQLRERVGKDTRLLDVGTGSGILSILSLMFGAKEALGTDLDPCAIAAVKDNCEKNGIDPERFRLVIGNIIDDKEVQEQAGGEYDIAVANILAEVLIPLMPVLHEQLKSGGEVILSGIIDGREGAVRQAMEQAGFTDVSEYSLGEWHCLTGGKA